MPNFVFPQQKTAKLKILLIGFGSIGQRHFRLLQAHFPHKITIFHHSKSQKKQENSGKNEIFSENYPYSWEKIPENYYDIAFICNPTYLHIETAIECAKRGMHLFVEKPIDCKLDRLDELLEIVEQKRLTSYVTYPIRHSKIFYPLTFDFLSRANFICCTDLKKWGKEYSRNISTGGGILLELSHEIDLAQYMLGKIETIRGHVGYKDGIDAEAFLSIDHKNGKTSTIILNLFAEKEIRFVQLITGEYPSEIETIKYEADDNTYLRQLYYFFNNISNPRMMNNLFEASELFNKIIIFRDANRKE